MDVARFDLPMSHGVDTRNRVWQVHSTAQELFAEAVGAKQTLFSSNGSLDERSGPDHDCRRTRAWRPSRSARCSAHPGSDLAIGSVHKTLSGLAQTSVVSVGRISAELVTPIHRESPRSRRGRSTPRRSSTTSKRVGSSRAPPIRASPNCASRVSGAYRCPAPRARHRAPGRGAIEQAGEPVAHHAFLALDSPGDGRGRGIAGTLGHRT